MKLCNQLLQNPKTMQDNDVNQETGFFLGIILFSVDILILVE